MIVDQKLKKGIIGAFLIDGNLNDTKLATTTKPNIIRRFLFRLLLGWKWVSINKLNK